MKIYLSIPYTFNPELSFYIANKIAASLMDDGHIVFSPISHSHHIADHLRNNLKLDHDFWMKQDLSLIEWCDTLFVVEIGKDGKTLIENSKGCQAEIKEAKKLDKQITYLYYLPKEN